MQRCVCYSNLNSTRVCRMKALDVKWTPQVNKLLIQCGCGNTFWNRIDRYKVRCPQCGCVDNQDRLRTELARASYKEKR